MWFFQVACPIFRSTGHESVCRPRASGSFARAYRRAPGWNKELEEPLYDCLGCGACTANCFRVPTADLVNKARTEYLEKVDRKPIHQLLFDYLLPYPRRLHLAARAVALGKNTGISRLARAIGLLRCPGAIFPGPKRSLRSCPLYRFGIESSPAFTRAVASPAYRLFCGMRCRRHSTGDR